MICTCEAKLGISSAAAVGVVVVVVCFLLGKKGIETGLRFASPCDPLSVTNTVEFPLASAAPSARPTMVQNSFILGEEKSHFLKSSLAQAEQENEWVARANEREANARFSD